MVLQAIKYEPATQSTTASLHVLNQLSLPYRTEYDPIHSCEDAHTAIRQMKVRGAPAIAIVAALALAVELGETKDQNRPAEEVKEFVGQRLDYLQTSRPTAVNLSDAVGKLKRVVKLASLEPDADGNAVARAYTVAAETMLLDDVSDNHGIGEHGANWIRAHTVAGKKAVAGAGAGLKILTHCNTG